MNQAIKTSWMDALRSGNYTQGTGTLRSISNNFCCLGVLCDLYIKETGLAAWIDDDPEPTHRYIFRPNDPTCPTESGYLSAEVRTWAGISDQNPMVRLENGSYSRLTALNDTECRTFPEIADIIQTNELT